MQLLTTFEDRDLLVVTARDDVGTAIFQVASELLRDDPRFHDRIDVLFDVRPLDAPPRTINEAVALGARLTALLGETHGRVALLAPAGEPYSQLWAAASIAMEAGLRMSVFDDEGSARQWLADQSRRYRLDARAREAFGGLTAADRNRQESDDH